MSAFCYLCLQGSDNSDIDDVFGCTTTTASQTGSLTIGVDAIDTYNIADDRQNVGDSGRVSVCVCACMYVCVTTYAGGLVSHSQTMRTGRVQSFKKIDCLFFCMFFCIFFIFFK